MSLQALLNTVRAHGLRVSTARRRVLVALLRAERPLTADEIAGPRDVASVYRNLEALESIGLVRRVRSGHGAGRYALAAAGGWASCDGCGEAVRLDPLALARIREALLDACGFDAPSIVGRCPACQGAPE